MALLLLAVKIRIIILFEMSMFCSQVNFVLELFVISKQSKMVFFYLIH